MKTTERPADLPQLAGRPVVTDGGLETDLVFHHQVDLPEFAAFVLLDDDKGQDLLIRYFREYVDIAVRAGASLQLDTPTWRASSRWGDRLGYDAADLRRVNREAVELLMRLRDDSDLESFMISGNVGPRYDGYAPEEVTTAEEAAAYHTPQIEALAEAGADLITALTLTGTAEAIGIVRAARSCGLPVATSFTVETDGKVPDGTPLSSAVTEVDAHDGPDYFMVNCAHPTHIAAGLHGNGDWRQRIVGLRANASTMSHEELDNAPDLDEGDPVDLARTQEALRAELPNLALIGGCCGTDARHIATMWGVAA